ncbi:hypothetical protein ACLKA6_009244 [Drosophila palustris]
MACGMMVDQCGTQKLLLQHIESRLNADEDVDVDVDKDVDVDEDAVSLTGSALETFEWPLGRRASSSSNNNNYSVTQLRLP